MIRNHDPIFLPTIVSSSTSRTTPPITRTMDGNERAVVQWKLESWTIGSMWNGSSRDYGERRNFHGGLIRDSPKSTGRITGPSSVTPPTMFGHVYPPSIWIRFYIRVSHSATTHWTNIYGVRTVRGILRRPSDEMFRSIITAGACAEYRGRWVRKRRQPRHQDGDAGDNAVSVVARRRRRSLPADNAKVFAQVTMHLDEAVKPANRWNIDRLSLGWLFRNLFLRRDNCLWLVFLCVAEVREGGFEKVEVFWGRIKGFFKFWLFYAIILGFSSLGEFKVTRWAGCGWKRDMLYVLCMILLLWYMILV